MAESPRLGAQGSRWAVACPHALASEAGADAFRAGGNAVDAALAMAATLTVVYPHMNQVGGDIMALVAAPDGTITSVNGSGAAARAVDVEALRRAGTQMPLRGPHPITVPGAVAAWESLHALGARRPLAAAIRPAAALAESGVPVAPNLAAAIAEAADVLAADAGCRALFLPGGAPLGVGAPLVQPALARTLGAIAEGGADALYRGEVGAALVRHLRTLGSALSVDDLAAHASELTAPLVGRFRDLDVVTSPPNSQGVLTAVILGALERAGDPADPFGADAGLLAALFHRSATLREHRLVDPRAGETGVDELLSDAYLASFAAAAGTRARGVVHAPDGDTIGLVAADADGWSAVIIQSVFYGFGAAVLDPTTGILCQNRGAFFALDPAEPNVLAGGKRTAHTLMPILLRRGGRVVGVHGTMGGTAQAQIHAQLILRVLAGLDAAAAVAAPRLVVGRRREEPDDLALLESGLRPEAFASVRRAGMPVVDLGAAADDAGHSHVIRITADGLDAGTDPRADGAALAG